MKNKMIGLLSAVFLSACANPYAPEVSRIPPLRESSIDLPCIEVVCLTDSLGVIVRCDTIDCGSNWGGLPTWVELDGAVMIAEEGGSLRVDR